MIKAVIFDMNGVIVNDEPIHELAFKETLKPFQIGLDHKAYLECCVGKTDQAGYEYIAEKYQVDLPIKQLLMEKAVQYRQLFRDYKQAYPDVIDLIHNLATLFKLAVTSSSSRREVDLILKEFAIYDLFTTTISANDVVYGKPDPEPYIKTAKLLNVAPHECVVIEDTRSGVRSAKAAGTSCIAITTTHPREELAEADVIVDVFKEIKVEMIKSLAD